MNKSKHTPGPWKVEFSQIAACGICHKIKQDDDVECPVACLWEGEGGELLEEQEGSRDKRLMRG